MTTQTAHDDRWPTGHVGYVALLGRPNSGKSTLVNTLLGQHLAAVSTKPQTTRRRFLGIVSDADSQMLFLDVPGVHRPAGELGQAMVRSIEGAVADADVVVCVADPTRASGEEDGMVAAMAASSGLAVLLVVTKCDLAEPDRQEAAVAFYRARLPDVPVFRVCALQAESLPALRQALRSALPRGPFLYPPDQVTDSFERDIGAELIREACLERLREEIPHAVAVSIESWQESARTLQVAATLHLEREAHKPIVIGRGGQAIKAIRRAAESKLTELCGTPVSLRLWVRVTPGWRGRKNTLRELGLQGP
ncbi:MAG: GTPase Era [Lentisphaeria bacterium]|nr:GTPase Era [Lentisphaeria bacterium]